MKPEPLKTYSSLDQFIGEQSAIGWQVISRTDSAVQMRKPKVWSRLGITLGVLGLLVYGAGLIILLLTVLDYLFQREAVGYVTSEQLISGAIPEAFIDPRGSYLTPILTLLLIFAGFTLLFMFLISR
jgi:hypothetical protein